MTGLLPIGKRVPTDSKASSRYGPKYVLMSRSRLTALMTLASLVMVDPADDPRKIMISASMFAAVAMY